MSMQITAATSSEAWLRGAAFLSRLDGGKAAHLCVSFPGDAPEDDHIRRSVDAFLGEERKRKRSGDAEILPVQTVANTLFPEGLYHPGRPDARAWLYRAQARIQPIQRRVPANRGGTYFDRLIACPGPEGGTYNQLEHTIEKLSRRGKFSSTFELSLLDPVEDEPAAETGADIQEDLRVYLPWKDSRKLMGFPCLSHLSLTRMDGKIHMSATYRNQHFIRKAYGNYLGLQRLLRFFCLETGCAPGEILCLATHADLELSDFGKKKVAHLLSSCLPSNLLVVT